MATKQQIPVVAARLTEFQEEFSKLPTEEAQWVIMNGKEAAALFARAVSNRFKATVKATVRTVKTTVKAAAAILGTITSTITIIATTEEFVAKEKFIVNTGKRAKVKISYIGGNFWVYFIGKIEQPFSGSAIYGRKLKEDSVDAPILTELGGEDKVETTLTEIYVAMSAQPNGENGGLLAVCNINYVNIFYVRDINGILRTVRVLWEVDGWNIEAFSVGHPDYWHTGSQVFSRNFSVSQAA